MRDLSVGFFAITVLFYAHMAMAQYSTGWNFTWPVATQQCAVSTAVLPSLGNLGSSWIARPTLS